MKIYRKHGVKLHVFCTSAIIKKELKLKRKLMDHKQNQHDCYYSFLHVVPYWNGKHYGHCNGTWCLSLQNQRVSQEKEHSSSEISVISAISIGVTVRRLNNEYESWQISYLIYLTHMDMHFSEYLHFMWLYIYNI